MASGTLCASLDDGETEDVSSQNKKIGKKDDISLHQIILLLVLSF